MGCTAYLIDNADEINPSWLVGNNTIGVTAGASAPELLVQQVVVRLQQLGVTSQEEVAGTEETIVFAMPKALREEVEAH